MIARRIPWHRPSPESSSSDWPSPGPPRSALRPRTWKASTPETPGHLPGHAGHHFRPGEEAASARKFQATVMAREGRRPDRPDHGGTASPPRMPTNSGVAGSRWREDQGRVVSGRPEPSLPARFGARSPPAADNAIARLRFKPSSKIQSDAFDLIQPAKGLTTRPYPVPSGQTVFVRMIDQHGIEHAVKAGNYSNPRLLAW